MAEDAADSASSINDRHATANNPRPLGLPDSAFEQRKPLRGQITKREVRAVSLYSLGLKQDSVVWDIGAGTGSMSVETALIAHRGTVYAIERDEASIGLLRSNVDQWASGNVRIVVGEAPDVLEALEDPDCVFVGGSGGRLLDILEAAARRLDPQGRIVVNLAVLERTQDTINKLKELQFETDLSMVSASRGSQLPDETTRLEALNPVFVVSAWHKS